MKLLLDENLSDRIIDKILDLYPESAHVKSLDLKQTEDKIIWEYAVANNYVIVSKKHPESLYWQDVKPKIAKIPETISVYEI